MHAGTLHYFPITLPFILVFFFLIGIIIALIEIGIIQYAYVKMGVSRRHVFALLILTLIGSYINIPVAQLPAERMVADREITFFGMQYVVPMVEEVPRTVIAVNVGGAIIPALLSLYLIVKKRMYGRTLLAVVVVTAVVHWMAYPVEGVGIAVPIFIPPLIAAGIALLLARQSAPSLAYISGSLGTLIGADLLNLDKIQGLGAPIASIGGAGTFDGIFMTGLLAVLLA
ncbi:MAG TPA: DUF1614 domain-containing protein [Gammaproteobacteria bacterium]|jgi:uncharacterized membrane protein|nr:DUF1614 domain-containing protein [Gammaproteobacteria bacterium]